MTIKQIWLILLLFMSISKGVLAQVGELSGSSICADGIQSTNIGVANADPSKYYALYRDDEQLQLRKSGISGKDQLLSFGTFKDIGTYTVVAFDELKEELSAKQGKQLNGKITISAVPVMYRCDTMYVRSGEVITFNPRANIDNASFTWSSRVKSGNVTGLLKKGSNAITNTLTLTGAENACVIFSITPYSAGQYPCPGETRDLVVFIKP